jgi:hypothetical protein
MLDQLRHRQHTGPQARIIRIDLENNPFDDLAGIRRGFELLNCAHDDATINRLPAGSISPSKFSYALSVSTLSLNKASGPGHQRAEQWRDRVQGCGIQGLPVGSRSGED